MSDTPNEASSQAMIKETLPDKLHKWLVKNKIKHNIIDGDTVEINRFGKLYINDLSDAGSIFRKNRKTGEIVFNLMCDKESLLKDGIDKVTFLFGDNWYWFDLEKGFELNILKYVGERERVLDIPFVNLGIHTPFELLNGSFKIRDWIAKAKHIGQDCIGICDKNTMAASLQLQKECEASGMRYVIGYTLDVVDGDSKFEVKVYCKSNEGLSNLLRLQKEINVDSDTQTVTIEQLAERCKGNVLVFGALSSYWLNVHENVVKRLNKICGSIYYQVDVSEFKANRIDKAHLDALREFYHNSPEGSVVKPALICDNYYLDHEDAKNKIILNKVAYGAAHDQSDQQYYKDLDELYVSFSSLFSEEWDVMAEFEDACKGTVEIAKGATARYETSRNFMPEYDMTEEERKRYGTRRNMFNAIIEDGFKRLVPKGQEERYRERVEKEKYVIESTNNIDYFLVQYDTVNWANKQGIMTGIARGSGGGCLLLYLMGITKLDPIKYDLIFERFLLPDRSGLYEADVTRIDGEMIDTDEVVELDLGDGKIWLDKDAELMVRRGDKETVVYADELEEGDDILFDNRDLLWTLKEIYRD